MTEEAVRQAAARFAEALDRNDFNGANSMLTSDCLYDRRAGQLTSEGIIVGPDAIIASYKSHDEWARQIFERVAYSSVIEAVKGPVATIRFVDEIEKSGKHHIYSSLQHIIF